MEHGLFRPSFARRSGLREGGKPVPIFRDHAVVRTPDPSRDPVSTFRDHAVEFLARFLALGACPTGGKCSAIRVSSGRQGRLDTVDT